MFLTEDDYKAVCDAQSLDVIQQSDEETRLRAEKYAKEEISSYIRSRYDVQAAFAAAGDERNSQLVMITADIALYHLVAWLPKKTGFEIRETRYNNAIKWLVMVQKGEASPDLPVLTDGAGNDIGTPMKYGSMTPNKYDY
jgi:phage gp36-like protein